MLRNYFKIAFRNLWKNKGYSAINIFGLAIGLATCLLITLYVTDELSYDRFNTNADRIYRINSDIQFGGGNLHMVQTSDMMGQTLKKDYPQVEQYTRIYANEGSKLIKKGNEFINEPDIVYVDSTFFDVFTFPAIDGNTKTALNEPNTVVLSETAAKKYFSTTNAVGKTIEIKNDATTKPFEVTAVIKDMPKNASFHFDFMLSMKNADYNWGQFTSHNFNTYLLLKKGTDYKAFEQNFDKYIADYVLPYVQQFIKVSSMEEFKKAGNKLEYSLLPLTKIHLYSDYSFELKPVGNIQYVYIFSAVELFILIIACINFMNLSTARSAKRAKEVGIRKVLGASLQHIVFKLTKDFLKYVLIAALIALPLSWFAINKWLQDYAYRVDISWWIFFVAVVLAVLIALITISFQAIKAAIANPVKSLRTE